ncbi:MAG: response regulator [Lachnospiraceae bacterium]|nr:response regulator [Lachnospiraceae bacterium]
MDERLKENELFQTAHIMILICYTIFATILIGESLLLGWETWALVLIVAGIVSGWIIHIRARIPEYARLWIYSSLMMATFFFYGIHPTSAYDLATVMCAVIILYSMTGVKKLILLCQITYLVTFAYDIAGMISSGFVFTSLEVTRSLLHIAMIIMVGWVARVIIDRWGRVLNRVGRELRELKEGTEQLNDFLANVSHEIRTPVNAVMGFTEVSMEMEKDERILGNMHSVMEAGRRINDQISDILDYSEIYRGSLAENCEDYMLSSVIYDVSAALMPLMHSSCELIIDVDPKCPAVLNSDSLKLKKILHHLLENSLKYTKEGGIYAHLYTVDTDYGVNLCIEVEDTGIGMEAQEAEKSTGGFYQGDSSRSRQGSGLGLGLAIVNGFTAAMGGFMKITSHIGEGTKVVLSLPQQVTDEKSCMLIPEKEVLNLGAFVRFSKFKSPDVREYYRRLMSNAVTGMEITIHRVESPEELKRLCDSISLSHLLVGVEEYEENKDFLESLANKTIVVIAAGEDFTVAGTSLCAPIPKPISTFSIVEILNMKPGFHGEADIRMVTENVRVLVVDDETMNLSVARGIFERYKMQVDTALSGYEAIERAGNREYDIIFMDHMMPGMDGVETVKRIRAGRGEKAGCPAIVALTANAVSTAREMFLKEGFDGFLSKPIELHELEHILKRVLPEDKLRYEPADRAEQAGTAGTKEAAKTTEGEGPEKSEGYRDVGIDRDRGLFYCQNDKELYDSVLMQYAKDHKEKAERLETAFAAGDMRNYEIYVHALKSTSKMIGAGKLSETAEKLENMASQGEQLPESTHREMMDRYRLISETVLKEINPAGTDDGGHPLKEELLGTEGDDDAVFEFDAENSDGDL